MFVCYRLQNLHKSSGQFQIYRFFLGSWKALLKATEDRVILKLAKFCKKFFLPTHVHILCVIYCSPSNVLTKSYRIENICFLENAQQFTDGSMPGGDLSTGKRLLGGFQKIAQWYLPHEVFH